MQQEENKKITEMQPAKWTYTNGIPIRNANNFNRLFVRSTCSFAPLLRSELNHIFSVDGVFWRRHVSEGEVLLNRFWSTNIDEFGFQYLLLPFGHIFCVRVDRYITTGISKGLIKWILTLCNILLFSTTLLTVSLVFCLSTYALSICPKNADKSKSPNWSMIVGKREWINNTLQKCYLQRMCIHSSIKLH